MSQQDYFGDMSDYDDYRDSHMPDTPDFAVCSDCLQLVANDISDHDEHGWINFIAKDRELRAEGLLLTLGGEILGFSHKCCDLCGALAGDRFALHTIQMQ